uniref:Uncharacterized protein n=1 Tax=Arundo donax TaxID=35708 RepID=A0A0A8ZBE5_ARUDO
MLSDAHEQDHALAPGMVIGGDGTAALPHGAVGRQCVRLEVRARRCLMVEVRAQWAAC